MSRRTPARLLAAGREHRGALFRRCCRRSLARALVATLGALERVDEARQGPGGKVLLVIGVLAAPLRHHHRLDQLVARPEALLDVAEYGVKPEEFGVGNGIPGLSLVQA